jgi:exonuclease III
VQEVVKYILGISFHPHFVVEDQSSELDPEAIFFTWSQIDQRILENMDGARVDYILVLSHDLQQHFGDFAIVVISGSMEEGLIPQGV